jgi:hypothetical protein
MSIIPSPFTFDYLAQPVQVAQAIESIVMSTNLEVTAKCFLQFVAAQLLADNLLTVLLLLFFLHNSRKVPIA